MSNDQTKPTAAELIEMIGAHRKELSERRDILLDQLGEVEKEMALLDGVKLPKPRAPRKDRGTKRKQKPVDAHDRAELRPQ